MSIQDLNHTDNEIYTSMSVAVLLYATLYQAVSLFANKVATENYCYSNYVYIMLLDIQSQINIWAEVENSRKPWPFFFLNLHKTQSMVHKSPINTH